VPSLIPSEDYSKDPAAGIDDGAISEVLFCVVFFGIALVIFIGIMAIIGLMVDAISGVVN